MQGRGSHIQPVGRFKRVHAEADLEHFENDPEFLEELRSVRTEYYVDSSKSVVTENDSPDVGYRFGLNPYRGCAHGCSYCYARPTHEYLGLSAGLDFESKVFVKENAAELFRAFLAKPSWKAEPIGFSGVTDCYQPAERTYRLTRKCLEVACEARQPITIITKNALICRDLDLLGEMAGLGLVHVNISLTTLDRHLAGVMEPRTSRPAARLQAIARLAEAGVPVQVLIAPVIPGLTDSEMPAVLEAAKGAGACAARYVLLRLPLTVAPIFHEWLARTQPTKLERVEGLIRQCREGELNNSQFGSRMVGTGPVAEQIAMVFKVFSRKHGLEGGLPPHDRTHFRPPEKSGQLRLF